ncbi:MAG: hypothetical protein J6X69_04300 [Bacteroidales bacterium]|nr:hypothetical protein [Bacteroidales bacterium]
MSSLLSSFDSKDIASINIRAGKSDSTVAGSYFHIFEERVIKSIFRPSIETGEKYLPGESDECKELDSERILYGRNHFLPRYFYVFAREILWKLGRWKSRSLDDYVTSFSPDVFFFPIESYIHFNRLNLYIIKKFRPKMVIGYMWDDNFTFKQDPCNPLYLLHRLWLRKGVRKLVSSCDTVFAICPKMKKELDKEFGIESVLLTKPVRSTDYPVFEGEGTRPLRLIYTGNLVAGRAESIEKVVDAIREMNKDGQKVVLDIYTGSHLPPKMKERIHVPGCCNLKSFIPQSEVFRMQEKADILLIAESFSHRKKVARLSFSTKITDYLSTGKCIWAVGNEDLGSIDYLTNEDAALVSTSPKEIYPMLKEIVFRPERIREYAVKGYECGVRNHSKESIQERFFAVLK